MLFWFICRLKTWYRIKNNYQNVCTGQKLFLYLQLLKNYEEWNLELIPLLATKTRLSRLKQTYGLKPCRFRFVKFSFTREFRESVTVCKSLTKKVNAVTTLNPDGLWLPMKSCGLPIAGQVGIKSFAHGGYRFFRRRCA